jgi:hypothetical protein
LSAAPSAVSASPPLSALDGAGAEVADVEVGGDNAADGGTAAGGASADDGGWPGCTGAACPLAMPTSVKPLRKQTSKLLRTHLSPIFVCLKLLLDAE